MVLTAGFESQYLLFNSAEVEDESQSILKVQTEFEQVDPAGHSALGTLNVKPEQEYLASTRPLHILVAQSP